MFDLSANSLILIFSAAAFGHLLLVPMANRWGLLAVLLGLYCIASPLSAAIELPGFQLFKYARVYFTILIVLSFIFLRYGRLGGLSKLLLAFSAFYVLASVWGPQPVNGVIFKGLTFFAVASGAMVAHSFGSTAQLMRGMQVFLYAGAALALVVLFQLAANPSGFLHFGRLMVWGINPNLLGQALAFLAVIALFFALFYPTRVFRTLGWIVGGSLLAVILYTGSRASLGVVVIAGLVMSTNLIRRVGRLLVAVLIAMTISTIALNYATTSATSRLTSVSMENRTEYWASAWRIFIDHPIAGVGWSTSYAQRASGSTINHLSFYLQTLAETGLIGGLFLMTLLLVVFFHLMKARRWIPRPSALHDIWALLAALLAALLGHGVAESSILMGSSVNTVLFGFAVGMCDRFAVLFHNDQLLYMQSPPRGREEFAGYNLGQRLEA